MKTVFFVLLSGALSFIGTGEILAQPSEVTQPVAPLWYNASFINNSVYISSCNSYSNGALRDNIINFYAAYIAGNQQVYRGFDASRGYTVCREASVAFREVISQGFREDSLMQTKPFSPEFLDQVLSNVYFYFAAGLTEGQKDVGRYNASLGHASHIWSASGRQTEACFARTIIHELGHALGLGEALADLKMEMFMGFDKSIRASHSLAYNSTFDRALLEEVGANRFWAAAYHSNEAYAALWDEVFGNIITHGELEIVRGVSLTAIHRPQLSDKFLSSAGACLEKASAEIFEDLLLLVNHSRGMCSVGNAVYLAAYNRLNAWVEFYVAFAALHNAFVSHSVFDWVIANHHFRFLDTPQCTFGIILS